MREGSTSVRGVVYQNHRPSSSWNVYGSRESRAELRLPSNRVKYRRQLPRAATLSLPGVALRSFQLAENSRAERNAGDARLLIPLSC